MDEPASNEGWTGSQDDEDPQGLVDEGCAGASHKDELQGSADEDCTVVSYEDDPHCCAGDAPQGLADEGWVAVFHEDNDEPQHGVGASHEDDLQGSADEGWVAVFHKDDDEPQCGWEEVPHKDEDLWEVVDKNGMAVRTDKDWGVHPEEEDTMTFPLESRAAGHGLCFLFVSSCHLVQHRECIPEFRHCLEIWMLSPTNIHRNTLFV